MATATELEKVEAEADRTLIFLSDLHLATDAEKRDFFAQDELAALLDSLIARPEPVDLVIAGDYFDLLQLIGTAGEDRTARFQHAFERPEYAPLIQRLRRFTATPRHRAIYLIGNHDAEIGWNEPLRRYLLDSGLVSEIALGYRYTYGDGAGNGCLIYCEHGNDYDGINTVGDYRNPAVTPLGSHIVTDFVNYLEPLGRHAATDAPTSIADIDNIHPLGMIPWWFVSNYFYQQVRRVVKYIIVPVSLLYLILSLLPLFVLYERFAGNLVVRGITGLPELIEVVLSILFFTFDGSALLLVLVWLLVRYDFGRTRRRYGLQDPDDIFHRGARHYRRTCEALVSGRQRPAHWPAEEPWDGADLFVYGHTHTQALTEIMSAGTPRACANTGTWTRKVIRLPTYLKLPPVFVPTYELNYVTVRRQGAAIRVELWEYPKPLEYRLPWTERLATLGRHRPRLRPVELAPRVLEALTIPFRPGVAAPVTRREEAGTPRRATARDED